MVDLVDCLDLDVMEELMIGCEEGLILVIKRLSWSKK